MSSPSDHTRKAANNDPNPSSSKKTNLGSSSSSHQDPNSTNLCGLIVTHGEEPATTTNSDAAKASTPIFSGSSSTPVQDTSGLLVGSTYHELAYLFDEEQFASVTNDYPTSSKDNNPSTIEGGRDDHNVNVGAHVSGTSSLAPVTTHEEPPRTSGVPIRSAFDEIAYKLKGKQHASVQTDCFTAGRDNRTSTSAGGRGDHNVNAGAHVSGMSPSLHNSFFPRSSGIPSLTPNSHNTPRSRYRNRLGSSSRLNPRANANMTQNVNAMRPPLPVSATQFRGVDVSRQYRSLNPNSTMPSPIPPANQNGNAMRPPLPVSAAQFRGVDVSRLNPNSTMPSPIPPANIMTQNVNTPRAPLPVSATQFRGVDVSKQYRRLNPNSTLPSPIPPANNPPRLPRAYNHVPEIQLSTPQVLAQVDFPLLLGVKIPPLPYKGPHVLPGLIFPKLLPGHNGDPLWRVITFWVPPGPLSLRVSIPSLLPGYNIPQLFPIPGLSPDKNFWLPLGTHNPHPLLMIEDANIPYQYLPPGANIFHQYLPPGAANIPHQYLPPGANIPHQLPTKASNIPYQNLPCEVNIPHLLPIKASYDPPPRPGGDIPHQLQFEVNVPRHLSPPAGYLLMF